MDETSHSESSARKNRDIDQGPVLRDHEHDGIQEYDQRLPNWWLFTFYITIVAFVVFWFSYYQLGALETDRERVEDAVARIDAKKAAELEAMMAELSDEVLWEMSRNRKIVAAGEQTFQTMCYTCHGKDLSGTMSGIQLPGESLADTNWKYGGNPLDVLKTVREGSPDKSKGMVAWEPIIGINKVSEVVAYIMSHHPAPPES